MKKITLLILLSVTIKITSQTANWTKDDRNNLYSDCMSYATKYKSISSEQKESICLCYLEETTKKYIKTDFEAKIDIEIKRIKDAMLTQCAKNIGVELTLDSKQETVPSEKVVEPVKSTGTKLTREFLVGKWKVDNNTIIEFNKDGTFVKTMQYRFVTINYGNIENNNSKGDWFLDEAGILTMNEKWTEDIGNRRVKLQAYLATGTYKFISFSENYIKYKFTNGAYSENIANKEEKEILQANRVVD